MILFLHYFNKLLDCSRLRARIKAKYFEEVMGARKNGAREGDTLIQHKTKNLVKLMHQTILRPAQPPPPHPTSGNCGGGAWANFCAARSRAFANSVATPELLTQTWFPIITKRSSRLANLSIACVAGGIHSTILQRLRRQISLDYYTIPPATQANLSRMGKKF